MPRLRKVDFDHDCCKEEDFNAVARGIEVFRRGRWGDARSPLKDIDIRASSDDYESESAWVDLLRKLPGSDDMIWTEGPVNQNMDCDTLCEDLEGVSLSASMEV